MNRYLEISPFNSEELEKIKLALDHEAYYLKRFSLSSFIEDIMMIGDNDRGRLIIDYVFDEIEKEKLSMGPYSKIYSD